MIYFLSLENSLVKYKKSFKPGARKFHFPKYKKNFFWKNIRNFFRVDFFLEWIFLVALGFSAISWKIVVLWLQWLLVKNYIELILFSQKKSYWKVDMNIVPKIKLRYYKRFRYCKQVLTCLNAVNFIIFVVDRQTSFMQIEPYLFSILMVHQRYCFASLRIEH